MKARTIFEQTGWDRGTHPRICQDIEVLCWVTEFDFNLDAPGFQQYFQDRTGYDLDSIEVAKKDRKVLTEHLANWRVPAPDSAWVITRAKLQDCWELWRGITQPPPQPQLSLALC
jgi:hypothetical protein